MKTFLINLAALFASVCAQNVPDISSSDSDEVQGNGGISVNAWSRSQRFNTGDRWDINDVWKQNMTGISYGLLSNPGRWHSWRNNTPKHSDVSKCNTWKSYKSASIRTIVLKRKN